MEIIIYSRDDGADKFKRFCFASHMRTTGTTVIFETDEWLPPRINRSYFLKVEEKEGQPAKFRQIDVGRHPAVKGPYTYMVKLGRIESGYEETDIGNEERDESAPKEKPDNP